MHLPSPTSTQPLEGSQRPEDGLPDLRPIVRDSLHTTKTKPPVSMPLSLKSSEDPASFGRIQPETQVHMVVPMEHRSCSCVESALVTLEALELEGHAINPTLLDQNLRLKKQTLLHCAEILSCKACNGSSSLILLIILLCQRVAGSYERLSQLLFGQFNKDKCLQELGLGPIARTLDQHGHCGPGHKDRALFLRDYETDPAEELCVYKGLIVLQLSKWRLLLSHVEKQCQSLDLDRHLAMVVAIERKIETQLEYCRK